MVYSEQNAAFINNKNQFFKQPWHPWLSKQEKIKQTDEEVRQSFNYKFLLENQISLEAEFSHLFTVLQKHNGKNSEEFWAYCYYCASLLEVFYQAYSQQAKVSEYSVLRTQIKNRLLNQQEPNEDETSFIKSLHDNFISSFRNLKNAPFHASQIRDYVAFSNVCRLYWIFCRLTLVNGLAFAKELQFIEKLDVLLGTHTDVDKIISIMQIPNSMLNYLSVGFFLGRFMIDTGMLLKHTFFPTLKEDSEETPAYERFKRELYKRHWYFANDLVWATVNFLTNFNHITHIPGSVAGGITAVFLGFDVCMILYRSYLLKKDYLLKKAQYEQEIISYRQDADLSSEVRLQHVAILHQQLQALEIDWRTKEAKLYFLTAAASLLMLGFSTALIFSSPGIIIASYFACTVAISMYLSVDIYAKYYENALRLEQAELIEQDCVAAHKEFTVARDDFIFTLAKNVIVPSVLITTFAICWPAAVVLTVVYLGYELVHSYDQYNRNQEIQQLALK